MDKPQLVYGIATDHAHTREATQDASTAVIMTGVSDAGIQDVGLFIVADGMAGQNDRESAPAIAVQTVMQEVVSQLYEPLMLNMGNYDVAVRTILANAFLTANQRLIDNPSYGTTAMTAALVNGNIAYIAHVGDTSAHAITPKGVEPLTTMHHLAHKLVEKGEATWDQINQNQVDVTNVLYRTIGKNEALEVDVVTLQLDANNQLLLCTDGLSGWNWEHVTKNDVNSVMISAYDLQFACNRLVSLAQERESIDAVTAIMVGLQP
ncbi:MAG: serine/threonine-protein phosphatase [Anaerolineae bacterium]|nr:serine/threonine-protein phosphatase [Anaerolineae bacterium]